MGIIVFVIFIIYSIAQMVAGYEGLVFHLGLVWAIVAILAAIFLRFTLPMTIFAFLGAMDVWHWHWALAAVFVAPGLVFIIPGVILSIINGIREK